ncbi:phenylacetic acid degradation protein PaaY [Caulobacter soli]|uniref:phenylacetic acid degradation protein PaaY n=1 Tax=Caulobacter soli TaxID=2708539 RepID=UPI0013EDD839|nr:phenylacetic acid degradation protein PaaY [Caulobacter soli]
MPFYGFEDLRPVVDPTAFVHPTAVLIGDVIIAPGCYVGPNAVLRGDFGRLILEEGANLQDNCVMHSFPGHEAVIEAAGHVGHGAILHGCRVGRNALIGMNAVIMDKAEIGADCIIGAMSFIKAGTVTAPATLWAGSPARPVRAVSEQERAWKSQGTQEYQTLARRCLEGLSPCEPLARAEPDRRRLAGSYAPLSETRA